MNESGGNRYFLDSLTMSRAFREHSPALARIARIIYPNLGESFWEKEPDCTTLNNDIEQWLERQLGEPYVPLCLKKFAETFTDGQVQCDQTTFAKNVRLIAEKQDLIRANIERRCAE